MYAFVRLLNPLISRGVVTIQGEIGRPESKNKVSGKPFIGMWDQHARMSRIPPHEEFLPRRLALESVLSNLVEELASTNPQQAGRLGAIPRHLLQRVLDHTPLRFCKDFLER